MVRGKAAQVEGEPGAGPTAADVVVEVAVQRLEGAVEVRREGDEQDPDVQLGQPESPGEQAQPVARLPGPVLMRGFGVRPGRCQETPYRVLGQVQAAQRIGRGGVGRAAVLDQQGDTVAEPGKPAQERVGRSLGAVAGDAGDAGDVSVAPDEVSECADAGTCRVTWLASLRLDRPEPGGPRRA
ncbi:hypothetical protein SAV31267_012180 [Streptomyces avermitilis]|uniref:Uncharacterized protein n=1 Tax=Streptomyces avermitilis TaxID=33903 RepID=A0A4D4MI54_STRAX|nr:hypothetical protein SAV31267_012180 [Streptomyces avermitilis]